MEGPMTPGNIGPKTIRLLKSLKIIEICVFFTWKRCASRFCEGSTERQLQIIDMELFGANCVFYFFWKRVSKLVNFGSIWMIWSCCSVLPSQNRDAHLFHVEKTLNFLIFTDLKNFMVWGPRFPGVMGPFIFWDFVKNYFMVWDLSRSVRKVFRSPGNPLIKLFHLFLN